MALITIVAQAQNTQRETGTFTLQPMLGASFGYLSGDWNSEPREKKKLIAGIVVGVEGEYYATKWLGISAGMNYTMQGWRLDYPERSVLTRLNYLNFPVMANIYVVQGLALKFGIQPAFNVNATYTTSTQGMDISVSLSDFGVEVKTFDFAIPVGLSYEFGNFVVDGRYNIGVTKMVEDDDSKNSVFQFTLGYKFSL